jgi:hypothetical protein
MIGHTDGNYARWDSSGAVRDFLPSGTRPDELGAIYLNPVDPERTGAGVLAGQLLALRLNVEYSCAGIFKKMNMTRADAHLLSPARGCYGSFPIPSECSPGGHFTGMHVSDFQAVADSAIAGLLTMPLADYGDANFGHINTTATCLNELFNNCDMTVWYQVQAGTRGQTYYSEAGRDGSGTKGISVRQKSLDLSDPVCEITYTLPEECNVRITVYDNLGQAIKVLIDEHQTVGNKAARWDGRDNRGRALANGIYLYRFEAGEFAQTKKLLLLR